MHLSRFTLYFSSICLAALASIPHPLSAQEPTPRPTFVNERSDLNQDNVVDAEDLLIFMQDWGMTSGPLPTPTQTYTPTLTETPSFTQTPTPTETPTTADLDVITINLPNLPADARPLRLVRIPAGTFQMGSPDTERGRSWNEGPVHTVNIGYDFYMGETEVTQAQWQAITGKSIHDQRNLGNPSWSLYGVGNDYPVYYVPWNDISHSNGFLDRLNALGQGTFRLPSEAEWEYACRAGTTTRFYFGDSNGCGDQCQNCAAGTLLGNRSDYMWYCFHGPSWPTWALPVARKLKNAFGLFEMHGNVWEWCQDYWYDDYVGAPTDGSPRLLSTISGHRVIRSGSGRYFATSYRSAVRSSRNPTSRYYSDVGFRVVLPASP